MSLTHSQVRAFINLNHVYVLYGTFHPYEFTPVLLFVAFELLTFNVLLDIFVINVKVADIFLVSTNALISHIGHLLLDCLGFNSIDCFDPAQVILDPYPFCWDNRLDTFIILTRWSASIIANEDMYTYLMGISLTFFLLRIAFYRCGGSFTCLCHYEDLFFLAYTEIIW